ncbi:MAG: pyruvate ferredoxin oxidoreductase [Actinobacteria bacterium]|nr:pyruvate ferredoxin oxidoreductase [Actinomycetota bacterium]MCG2796357.1 pyruvate ferredoxin oxidoreductase [Actinomycetes bacterium]MBU4241533.1 pyruvate ferredoxin oxidoreductase [Actinomycetota bacterium]MBU4301281.1 pyruvate ferredoxin oxidoreductase [Actinomycetota bacterium]MBU4386690.1 pyruvate ferredoxin oxidoreductase [Actinomycetota bacterium]
MGKRIGLEASLAVSEAVKMARADAVAAYPITPQTHIVEELSQMVADGDLDADFMVVESEHTAMSACCGASAVGARTFTATGGPGLALMHEMLYIASGLRLPIVMAIVNRAYSSPISIWGDHSDVMAQRDAGWIQFFAETGQEVFDLTIQAFKIAEDKRVLLPAAVNLDGFTLSHVIEPFDMPDQEEIDAFLPAYEPQVILDPDKPVTMGAVGFPEIYTEIKKQQNEALLGAYEVILEVWEGFEKAFGRAYHPVESYRTDDAEILISIAGSTACTARVAVDNMRDQGKKVGLVRTRLWRPYPFEETRAAVKGAKAVAVMDRCLSFGGPGGPICSELRSALYPLPEKPVVNSYIVGLGGRDITLQDFYTVVEDAERVLSEGPPDEYQYKMIGVRE